VSEGGERPKNTDVSAAPPDPAFDKNPTTPLDSDKTPTVIDATQEVAPRTEYSVFMARFEGRDAATSYLEALSNETLSAFDDAVVADLLGVLHGPTDTQSPPNE
jgi:hypothetical protein